MTHGSSAKSWRAFSQSAAAKNKASWLKQQSAGFVTGMIESGSNDATIAMTQLSNASGSVVIYMSQIPGKATEYEPEYFDDLDREIAQMTDSEILALIKSGAGMWADRDDLDDLMDRSDRMDRLYGYTSDNPDSPV